MASIFASSIGKKLIMSLSGLFLMLFLVMHAGINLLLLAGRDVYNAACRFMDTNPLIQVMVPVLAFGFFIHIVYAVYLTWNNWKARGTQAYRVANKGAVSSWAARNMFVLGLIIVGFLVLHLTHFWAKMQLAHYLNGEGAADPYGLVAERFSQPLYSIIYIAWFCALWLHLTHGLWSAFQTIGLNNSKWLCRWKIIAYIYATLITSAFLTVPVYFLVIGQNV
ncbi:MAG: succinate dehydrogenase cytochrome b subunit [Bacteroidales bacterium]|nr:succinate dehydrogenase cytochrome b subunit [Bacteroidales bacterium]MCL2132731.1 succinate dehydrogenase cytochrome b subunit [Bacteroidales bacterium]